MIPLQRVVLVDNDYVQGVHADEHALEVERAGPRLRAPRQPQGGVRAESWSGRNPRAASARPKTAQLICVAADRSTNLTDAIESQNMRHRRR